MVLRTKFWCLFAGLGLICAMACGADAGTISGVLRNCNGRPLQDQVHFENQVSGDAILVKPAVDGSFAVSLPPGVYDLREERGAVITKSIVVGEQTVALGTVREPRPYNPMRLLQLEGMARYLLSSPARVSASVPDGRVSLNAMVEEKSSSNAASSDQPPTPAVAEPSPPRRSHPTLWGDRNNIPRYSNERWSW